MKYKLKIGDNVVVISGEQKGEKGRLFKIDHKKERAFVEGVNLRSRHKKPAANNPQGGIVKKECSIHISNLSLIDPKSGKPTRVSIEKRDGNRVRVSKKSKEVI